MLGIPKQSRHAEMLSKTTGGRMILELERFLTHTAAKELQFDELGGEKTSAKIPERRSLQNAGLNAYETALVGRCRDSGIANFITT